MAAWHNWDTRDDSWPNWDTHSRGISQMTTTNNYYHYYYYYYYYNHGDSWSNRDSRSRGMDHDDSWWYWDSCSRSGRPDAYYDYYMREKDRSPRRRRQTAVAAAALHTAAVAGSSADTTGHEVLNFQHFRSPLCRPYYGHRCHGVALKWFQEAMEWERCTALKFDNNLRSLVPSIGLLPGLGYEVSTHWHEWRWPEMLWHMDDDSLTRCIAGLAEEKETSSLGIVSCSLVKTGRPDWKRMEALRREKKIPTEFPMEWDFVLETESGKKVGLHPYWDSEEIECHSGVAMEMVQPPLSFKVIGFPERARSRCITAPQPRDNLTPNISSTPDTPPGLSQG